MAGKGSRYRPVDRQKWYNNWDQAFRKDDNGPDERGDTKLQTGSGPAEIGFQELHVPGLPGDGPDAPSNPVRGR